MRRWIGGMERGDPKRGRAVDRGDRGVAGPATAGRWAACASAPRSGGYFSVIPFG